MVLERTGRCLPVRPYGGGGKAHLQIAGPLPDCPSKPRHVQLICAEDGLKARAGQLPNPRDLVRP